MSEPHTPLCPLDATAIPQVLKAQKRWAPWKAVWSEKRQKYDKIPCYPNGYGLSTAKPERWLSFEQALAAMQAKPDTFAGVGYVMTGPHGLVGTDLDRCVGADGTVAPWAAEIVAQMGSYAEISPSGHGLRIFTQGDIADDWTNHDIGIEVYAGNEPRFLTVTGQRLPQAPADVARPDPTVLAQLSTRYARERTTATVISLQMPDLLDELVLPDLATLDLPWQVRDFLTEGTTRGDRSRELFSSAVALYGAGLNEAEVFSVLAASPHAMEVALDHRRQDADRALMFLWVEQAQKAKGRGTSRVATLDDFEDVSEPGAKPAASAAPAKRMRYQIQQAAVFSREKPIVWAIKRLLPYADLGVVYGESGAGKSFFVLDLVLCLATGKPWRDRPVHQGAVLYVCAEGAGGFRARLQAYAEFHGIDLAEAPLYVLGDAPNIMEKADLKDLIEAARSIGVQFRTIVMDTLAQVTPGANENSGEDMGRALAHCKTLGQSLAAMTLLVAHAGKDASRGQRGWSGIKGALDVEILVERSGEHRAATITKMKDGSGEGDEHGFKLHTVTLGQDEDGDDITSCVIESVAAIPKAQRKVEPKGNVEKLVLRTAVSLTDLPGEVTTDQLVTATVDEMPKPEGKRDQRRAGVLRAIETLVASNRLSVAGGLVSVL